MNVREPQRLRKQSIAFVDNASKMSGVEFSTINLAKSLSASKWIPIVIVPGRGDLSDQCKSVGVRFEILPLPKFFSVGTRVGQHVFANPVALAVNSMISLFSAFQVYKFLRREPPALVVTKGLPAHFFGGLACAFARTPCIWYVQDRVSERLGVFYPLILSIAGRLLAAHIIADAESISKQLGILVPHRRISVIWNGVDTQEFSPTVDGSKVRREWSVSENEILLGVVARITPWKGQHVLLEAFAILYESNPVLRLVLVGSPMFDNDDYLNRLREIVRRQNLEKQVIFAGFRRDLPQVLAAIDIFVHTAVEKDSSPLSVVSAMAAGKAIICPRIEGVAELFRSEEDALLYTPGDARMLAQQLRRLITDHDLATRLGRSARRKAIEELGLDTFAGRCESVFLKYAFTQEPDQHA